MKKGIVIAALSACIAACGGGGSSSTTTTSSTPIAGIYTGTLSAPSGDASTTTTDQAAGVVLSSGEFYFIYDYPESTTVGGLIHGTIQNGAFNTTFTHFYGDSHDQENISGTLKGDSSLIGNIVAGSGDSAVTVAVSLLYQNNTNATPSLAAIAGNYSYYSALNGESGSLTVGSNGQVTAVNASNSSCTYTGSVSPTQAAFRLTLTPTEACGWSGTNLSGVVIAESDGAVGMAITSDNTEAMIIAISAPVT